MCNPWVVYQKKSQRFGSNVSYVSLHKCPHWWPSPICISSSQASAQCLPFPLPLSFCMLWRITFQCQCFLKGMGYLRCRLYVQRYDSCVTGDDPSRVSCETSLLMANLLVFSAHHQGMSWRAAVWVVTGGALREEIRVPGTQDRHVVLLQKERSPCITSRCLRHAMRPRWLPCCIFPHFSSISLTIHNFILS